MKAWILLLFILPALTLAQKCPPCPCRSYGQRDGQSQIYNNYNKPKYSEPPRKAYSPAPPKKYPSNPPKKAEPHKPAISGSNKAPWAPNKPSVSRPTKAPSAPIVNDLFISRHPKDIPRFEKYFTKSPLFQPVLGINHDYSHHGNHDHEVHGATNFKSFETCPQNLNWNGKYLVSTLDSSPDCPLMEYDEALNYCTRLGMKPVSVGRSSPQQEILSLAKIIPGNGAFWTDGFIRNPLDNVVYWHDMGEDIDPTIWADGQPDGPKKGSSEDIEFCVSVQKSSTLNGKEITGGKLHDRLCRVEMAAVCERNFPKFDLNEWMNILKPMRN